MEITQSQRKFSENRFSIFEPTRSYRRQPRSYRRQTRSYRRQTVETLPVIPPLGSGGYSLRRQARSHCCQAVGCTNLRCSTVWRRGDKKTVATVLHQQDGIDRFFSGMNSISRIESRSQAAISSVRDNQEPNNLCRDTI